MKVLGLAIAGALPGSPRTRDPAASDVRAAGAIFYAALTARWPYGAAYGLGAAPYDSEGRPRPPRQVRAGVPREADAIAAAALRLPDSPRPPLHTAEEFLTALQRLPGDADDRRAPLGPHLAHPTAADTHLAPPPLLPPARRRHRFWRRVLLIVMILLVVGAVSWWAGASLGRVRGPDSSAPPPVSPSSPGSSAPAAGAVLPLGSVEDFDPPPGDGHEHAELVAAAHDGDLTTAWVTDRYFDDARFGGIKPGVGLRIDLGRPMQVSEVELVVPNPVSRSNCGRVTPRARSLPTTRWWRPRQRATPTLSFGPPTADAHRYWLVWLTALTPVPSGYQGGISEMVFRS